MYTAPTGRSQPPSLCSVRAPLRARPPSARAGVQCSRGNGCSIEEGTDSLGIYPFSWTVWDACMWQQGKRSSCRLPHTQRVHVRTANGKTWRASIPAAHFCVASLPTDAAAIRVACSTINTHVALFIRASTFPLMVLTIDFCFSQASHNLADMLFAVFMFVGALPIIIAVPTASMNVRMPCDRAQAHPQDSGVESR